MATESEKTCENGGSPPPTPVEGPEAKVDPNSERAKATRHPRWTRQETIVLIEAKKVVENGGYTSAPGFVPQHEPKWDMVSSFCQKQGVNRGPVQCRKRWSNLLSDFKKIKRWESHIKEKAESFWMMRNDERREKKLPSFFDGEVYNTLDGGARAAAPFPLSLIKTTSRGGNADAVPAVESEQCRKDEAEEEEDTGATDDSEKMGWSTEEETIKTTTHRKEVTPPLNVEAFMRKNPKKTSTHPLQNSGKQYPPSCQGNCDAGSGFKRQPMSQEGCKRRRLSPDNSDDTTKFNNQCIKVLKRNSNILKAHIGAQNINNQRASYQQKEQTNNLVAALGKLTDALIKIADKL